MASQAMKTFQKTWEQNMVKTILIPAFVLFFLCESVGLLAQEKQPTEGKERGTLKIKLSSVYVDDQEKALKFYTDILGFVKKADVPVGKFKWLTVVSPDEPEGTELLLEPNDNPATRTFQKALLEQGIPLTMFAVEDVQKEYERLTKLGVVFTVKPTRMGTVTIAVFNDTCGNLIQIGQI
jgi:catechol 2,3-dioxygenase-like lactoylglutathione lyase family enzyme